MLDKGRILESGTHKELMDKKAGMRNFMRSSGKPGTGKFKFEEVHDG